MTKMHTFWCLSLASMLLLVSCQRNPHSNTIKKYHVIKTQETWYRALHYCHSRGMRFASILSKTENDQIVKEIQDSGIGTSVWIGGTCLGNEPIFYWIDHSRPMSFANWQSGDPNNFRGYEDCLEMRYDLNLKWNDRPCDEKENFVCEEQISNLPGTQSLHDLLETRSSRT